MIKRLQLSNFKCFENFSMDMKKVNILTGINGMGKSTVIQSLLLLHQSDTNVMGAQGLNLNGRYVHLGTAQDVLFDKAETDEIMIAYRTVDNRDKNLRFLYAQDQIFLPLIPDGNNSFSDIEKDLFGDGFVYLSAYRIRPQELYGITNEEYLDKKEYASNGEYSLQYLNVHGDDDLSNQAVVIPDKSGSSLMNQTRLWMDKISPGVSPQVFVRQTSRTSELYYEFVEGKDRTNSYKSINVGFGITYVLPVIIALLSAGEGNMVLIENPEAHIHPSGQRMLGELIALAGAGGVQVVVETHSDHILNGIRIAAKQKKIDRMDINLSFFYKDEKDGYRHKYIAPTILPDGRLDIWPKDFFDEWDKALYELL